MDTSLLAAFSAMGAGASIGALAIKALLPHAKLSGTKGKKKPQLTRKPPTRDCQAIGFYGEAIRNKDGSFTKGYLLNPNPTQFTHDFAVVDQISRWASLFRSKLPVDTVIQVRMSCVPDPGEIIFNHLNEVENAEVNANALQLHMLGTSYLLSECQSGRFRLPRLTVWVKTPSQKAALSIADQIKAIAKGTDSNITTRLADEERAAYSEALKTFRLFEQECPIPFSILTKEQSWAALYLSARQDAATCPPVLPDGQDVRDHLCAESITTNGWYVMHGSIPVTVISMLAPPQPEISEKAMRTLTLNGNLNFGRWTLIHEFVAIDQKKAKAKLNRRYGQAGRSKTSATGKVKMDKTADLALRELHDLTEDLATGRECLLAMRSFCVLYGQPSRTKDELTRNLAALDEQTEIIISTFRQFQGSEVRREEPASLGILYPKTLVGEFSAAPTGREIEETAGSLAAMVPHELEWAGAKRPHSIFTTPGNRLHGMNLFDRTLTPSPLGIFLAASGNGKTTLIGKIIQDVLASIPNARVKAVDYREGLKPLTEVLGGRHIKLDPNTNRTLNIWFYPGFYEGLAPDDGQIGIVSDFYMNLAGIQFTDNTAYDIIVRMVQEVYKEFESINRNRGEKKEPTLSKLLDLLGSWNYEGRLKERAAEILNSLEKYRDKYFVDAPTHPDFIQDTVFDVYELGNLNEFSGPIKVALASAIIARVLRSVGKPNPDGTYSPMLNVALELNEIRREYPQIIPVFVKSAQTGRKENVVTLIEGQSYSNIEDIPAFRDNAGFRIIGKQSSRIGDLALSCGFSENTEAAIRTIQNLPGVYSQFVTVYGSDANQKVEMIQVELSPIELWVSTSHPDERNARTRVQALRPDWTMINCVGWLAQMYPRGLTSAGRSNIDESLLQ